MAVMAIANRMRVFHAVHARLPFKDGNEWNRHPPVKKMNTLSSILTLNDPYPQFKRRSWKKRTWVRLRAANMGSGHSEDGADFHTHA